MKFGSYIRYAIRRKTNYTRADLIFWDCLAHRNRSATAFYFIFKLCCNLHHPFKNTFTARSVPTH